jgi:hypothetical protein
MKYCQNIKLGEQKVRLDKNNVLQILNRNFGFKIVSHPVADETIRLSALDAYLYSSITGHPYLCNLTGGFSPNGLM